jgi:ABC-type branched-subunit amino acid transport system ATPase component
MSVLESVLLGYYPGPYAEYIDFHKKRLGGRQERKVILEKAIEALDLVHMAERKDQPFASLRHGDRKKLELARALINDPKLVLLDEPVAGLSISETWRIADLILKLRGSGTTVLLVEHDIDWVKQMSDVIVLLSQGKKVAQGTPREISDKEVTDAYLAWTFVSLEFESPLAQSTNALVSGFMTHQRERSRYGINRRENKEG